MKIKMSCVSLLNLVAIFSLICCTRSSSSSSIISSFLGIAPQDENYFKTESIKCRNGSNKFNKAQLNDGFCDCPDGTDEPGTSACPQGKFYCQNKGHIPVYLYSSRVNDGICDCCDGSDEYDGRVKCPDTCWEAGKVARDKLQKKIDTYRDGVLMRKKEIEQAKKEITKDKMELAKLKSEEKVLKRLVKQLDARKEQIEKAEEKERLKKEEEKMKEDMEDKDRAGHKVDDDQRESSKNTNDDQIGTLDETSLDQLDKDEYEKSKDSSEDMSKSSEDLSREELGRLVASRWTGENTAHEVDKNGVTGDKHGDDNETPDNKHDYSDTKELSANNLDESRASFQSDSKEQTNVSVTTTSSTSSWLRKLRDTVLKLFQSVNLLSTAIDNLDVDSVRKEYDDSSSRLSDIEEKISSLTEKLKHDFGEEKEFYLLYDQCFETKQDKYVYKVCPFKDAFQEEGYSKTELGQWDKFENSYSMMVFSNGQGCWNGPDRSLKVKLRCGLKTELAGVNEPSRCEYTAVMTTPLRCLEGKLKELEQKLDLMYKETQSHDEL